MGHSYSAFWPSLLVSVRRLILHHSILLVPMICLRVSTSPIFDIIGVSELFLSLRFTGDVPYALQYVRLHSRCEKHPGRYSVRDASIVTRRHVLTGLLRLASGKRRNSSCFTFSRSTTLATSRLKCEANLFHVSHLPISSSTAGLNHK